MRSCHRGRPHASIRNRSPACPLMVSSNALSDARAEAVTFGQRRDHSPLLVASSDRRGGGRCQHPRVDRSRRRSSTRTAHLFDRLDASPTAEGRRQRREVAGAAVIEECGVPVPMSHERSCDRDDHSSGDAATTPDRVDHGTPDVTVGVGAAAGRLRLRVGDRRPGEHRQVVAVRELDQVLQPTRSAAPISTLPRASSTGCASSKVVTPSFAARTRRNVEGGTHTRLSSQLRWASLRCERSMSLNSRATAGI